MTPRVIFDFNGQHFDLSTDESLCLLRTIARQRDRLRVKCPTCRCRIMPDSVCGCCAGAIADVEPMI